MLELAEFPVSDCANYCEVPAHKGCFEKSSPRTSFMHGQKWVICVVLESQIHS